MNSENLDAENQIWNRKTNFDRFLDLFSNLEVPIRMMLVMVLQSAIGYAVVKIFRLTQIGVWETLIPIAFGTLIFGFCFASYTNMKTKHLELLKKQRNEFLSKLPEKEREAELKEDLIREKERLEKEAEARRGGKFSLVAFLAIMAIIESAIGWVILVKIAKIFQAEFIEMAAPAVIGTAIVAAIIVHLERKGLFENIKKEKGRI